MTPKGAQSPGGGELLGLGAAIAGAMIVPLVAGVLIGWVATRVRSLQAGLLVGLAIGAFFAFLIAAIPQQDGTHYWWQIMLPGSVLGLIVGYATQRYGRPAPVGR